MENAERQQEIVRTDFGAKVRLWATRELPVYLFLFAYFGMNAITGKAGPSQIAQPANRGLGIGILILLCFLTIRSLFWRSLGLKHSPVETWAHTTLGRTTRFVGLLFLSMIAGSALGQAYGTQAPFQLHALFWGLILLSIWSIGFRAGKLSTQ